MSNQVQVEIDASGKRLGRIATEVATILNGKDEVSYMPNKAGAKKVKVVNASQLQLSDKKQKQKVYERYTGYFGGLRKFRMEQIIAHKGHSEIVRKAVYGMLPANRLRSVKMNNLTIED